MDIDTIAIKLGEGVQAYVYMDFSSGLCIRIPKNKQRDDIPDEFIEITDKHPNLCKLYNILSGLNLSCGTNYFGRNIEYINGQSLRHYCGSLNNAVKIIKDIVVGISFMHNNGFNHGDIKPDNIMLSTSGNAVIVDYGNVYKIDKIKEFIQNNNFTMLSATSNYRAPELYRFNKEQIISNKFEVYSIGITAFELIDGSHPAEKIVSVNCMYELWELVLMSGFSHRYTTIFKSNIWGTREMQQIKSIIEKCLQINTNDRIDINQLLSLLS